jgi:hypothetical protein
MDNYFVYMVLTVCSALYDLCCTHAYYTTMLTPVNPLPVAHWCQPTYDTDVPNFLPLTP